MRKIFAFACFVYHYLAYQIPMKRMNRSLKKAIEAQDEVGIDNFYKATSAFTASGKKVLAHMSKCDHYRAIIES